MTKICTRCSAEKPLTEFYKHKGHTDGYNSHCKFCMNTKNREWAVANPERRKAIRNKYSANNREIIRAKTNHKYATDDEYRKRKNTRDRDRFKKPEIAERTKTLRAIWKAVNAERIKEKNRQWRLANLERKTEQNKRWRKENPERTNELTRKWAAENKEYCKLRAVQRRAVKRACAANTTLKQIQARIEYFGSRCWMCRKPYEAIDHVKPIAKGGAHFACNLRPACKSCNSHKNKKWYGVKALHQFIKQVK